MSADSTNKPPVWFWVVSVLALIWNIIGVMSYLAQAYTSVEDLEKMTQHLDQMEIDHQNKVYLHSSLILATSRGSYV